MKDNEQIPESVMQELTEGQIINILQEESSPMGKPDGKIINILNEKKFPEVATQILSLVKSQYPFRESSEEWKNRYMSLVPLVEKNKVLRDALEKAIEVIKQWHNADDAWSIYLNHAPEMKPIREALKQTQL